MPPLFTIGHSNHGIETFLDLLIRQGVTVLADVRSHPVSRFAPHFSKDRLRASLGAAGIGYLWLGEGFGARPRDPACFEAGIARHALIAAHPAFAVAKAALVGAAGAGATVCLMCAERDPLGCHRTALVSRRLRPDFADIRHIHGDGTVEDNAAFEARLVAQDDAGGIGDLFADSPIEAAYDRQSATMAWRGHR
ncbi:DUF488 domain-containing protein [Oleomonas cavernae]|uniref:DUF488 domain-containing protein n=1 Tax=Oleomonas cavernae TaxID=2320859 RepID=A0A418WDI6_9PROT|nr:DUF488 domain-containing protein [Oleomonas cavernae]RJF88016.1 DUF488 domain-containing protein [Oleomonas cavernae]